MKTIIAGSRTITNPVFLAKAIAESGFFITEVISGRAPGVDTLGERWARMKNIPITLFPANWAEHGKAAGPIRNQEMAEYGDALLLVWDGKSSGSKDMLSRAKARGLQVYVLII